MVLPKYGYQVSEAHDVNLQFCPSIGMYTLFPCLSDTQIVVSDNRLMCCCYGLRIGGKVIVSSKKRHQWPSKYVCLLGITVSPHLVKQELVTCNWDAVCELVTE